MEIRRKATIGIDVDSVVADLATAWTNRYNLDYDDNLQLSQITDWGIQNFVKPECGLKIFDYLEDPSLYDDVFPIEGSIDAIHKLKYSYYRVVYITSTTLGANGRKYQWLKDWGFIESMTDYVEANDKRLIATEFLLDDRYENARDAWGVGVLFTRPWNMKYDFNNRVIGWKGFTDWLIGIK